MISLLEGKASLSEKAKDILMSVLYLSFIVFSNDSIGVYYMIVLVLTIFVIHGRIYGFSVNHLGFLHLYIFGVSSFCFVSSIWAESPDYAIEKGITLLELLIAFSLIYEAYYKCSVNRLLLIVMWSGFLLSLYTIMFVGLGSLQDTIDSAGRMDNTFANINVIGMCCSTSVILAVYFLQKRKNILDALLCIPCLIVVAASGSRKAFVMLAVGALCVMLYKPYENKSSRGMNKVAKLFISLCVLSVMVVVMWKLGLFGGTLERMDGLVASLTGQGDEDSSSMIRAYYRLIGFRQFSETPYLGIGMGNGRLLAMKYTGHDCYLHCNYAEIAADGGIVGLFMVYWLYIKLLKREYRLLKIDSYAVVILLLVVLNLILDYGKVSYYSKDTYFMLMICCLHISKYKNDCKMNYKR